MTFPVQCVIVFYRWEDVPTIDSQGYSMKTFLLASTMLVAIGVSPASSTVLTLEAFDNGVSVGVAVSTTGTASLRVTDDPAFDIIDLSAAGSPFLPGGDLSSVTLNVTSGAISTTHTLTVDVFQTGISVPAHTTENSTFTTNNLVGSPGPTTESTFADGTNHTLGTLLATHTFPLGTSNGTFGPISTSFGAMNADAHQYLIGFHAPDQSANDTIQLTTGIPELSTWAMVLVGFAGLAWGAWSRKKVNRLRIAV